MEKNVKAKNSHVSWTLSYETLSTCLFSPADFCIVEMAVRFGSQIKYWWTFIYNQTDPYNSGTNKTTLLQLKPWRKQPRGAQGGMDILLGYISRNNARPLVSHSRRRWRRPRGKRSQTTLQWHLYSRQETSWWCSSWCDDIKLDTWTRQLQQSSLTTGHIQADRTWSPRTPMGWLCHAIQLLSRRFWPHPVEISHILCQRYILYMEVFRCKTAITGLVAVGRVYDSKDYFFSGNRIL